MQLLTKASIHYNDVIMGAMSSQIKENIKAPRHWPLCGEFIGDRWIPCTNGQQRGKCFHLMTSSCQWRSRHDPNGIWHTCNTCILTKNEIVGWNCPPIPLFQITYWVPVALYNFRYAAHVSHKIIDINCDQIIKKKPAICILQYVRKHNIVVWFYLER